MEFHINDLFWTIQGEGFHAGRRALFVRMPYCNLACSWCDTTFNSYKKFSLEDFSAYANTAKAEKRFAVITGGEPLMHKHTEEIIDTLKILGFEVACESNGTIQTHLYTKFNFVTISPKRFSKDKGMEPYFVSVAAMATADEFKYVVDDQFDFSILDRHKDSTAILSLSPEFNNFEGNVKKIIDYIERNPQWKISLQTHKFLKIP